MTAEALPRRTLIVVPTRNEADNIAVLLDGLAVHVPAADIVVLDDISDDATRAIVRSMAAYRPNVRLIERDHVGGLGTAYVHGLGLALDDGYDLVVEMDADLSHDPAALPTLLAVADLGIDVVIGSRYVPGGSVVGWAPLRTWLSRWGNRYAAVMLGLAINDATSGFRVYRAEALRRVGLDGIRARGFGFQVEMSYRAIRHGQSVVEVPIEFRDRVAGRSKVDAGIVLEAFGLITAWGLIDLVTLRRRRRAYRTD